MPDKRFIEKLLESKLWSISKHPLIAAGVLAILATIKWDWLIDFLKKEVILRGWVIIAASLCLIALAYTIILVQIRRSRRNRSGSKQKVGKQAVSDFTTQNNMQPQQEQKKSYLPVRRSFTTAIYHDVAWRWKWKPIGSIANTDYEPYEITPFCIECICQLLPDGATDVYKCHSCETTRQLFKYRNNKNEVIKTLIIRDAELIDGGMSINDVLSKNFEQDRKFYNKELGLDIPSSYESYLNKIKL